MNKLKKNETIPINLENRPLEEALTHSKPQLNTFAEQLLMDYDKIGTRTQRDLAQEYQLSLGKLNQSLRKLQQYGLLNTKGELSESGQRFIQNKRPARAIIWADQFGLSVANEYTVTPRALLNVQNSTLIERQIKQILEAGIPEIYIIVGYQKERFEFLSENPKIKLLYNPTYKQRGNLSFFIQLEKLLSNAYVLQGHLWFANSPFSRHCFHSWATLSIDNNVPQGKQSPDANRLEIRKDRSIQLARKLATKTYLCHGLYYFTEEAAKSLIRRCQVELAEPYGWEHYWEEFVFQPDTVKIYAKLLHKEDVQAIQNTEDFLLLQGRFADDMSTAQAWAATVLNAKPNDLHWLESMKAGMTNRTLAFSYQNQTFLLRIPGKGTEHLLNRREEATIYTAINEWQYAEKVAAFNPATGHKLSLFIPATRPCDPHNKEDLTRCMKILHHLHHQNLQVSHRFDLFEKMKHYQKLCGNSISPFKKMPELRQDIERLRLWMESLPLEECLCHNDFNPDNLLLGENETVVIDWEYAGMQHPLCDLAMFAIYANYNEEEIKKLAEIYYQNKGRQITFWEETLLFAFVACGGFLWSIWCQYKANQGIEFGDYWRQQYVYARDYSKKVLSRLPQLQETRTENAIILAAGASSRFVPHALEKPKCLWMFRGEILIERQIKQLQAAGIKSITLVTGYMNDQFTYLRDLFNIELVHNPYFATRNNISSLYLVREKLGQTYICSADNYFSENVFQPYDERPYYATRFANGPTSEWCVTTDDEGKITQVSIGGSDTYYMIGQVRLDTRAADRLRKQLEAAWINPDTHQLLWEEIYRQNLAHITLYCKPYPEDSILEFDSVDEIIAYDPAFLKKQNCRSLSAFCADNGLEPENCHSFEPLKIEGYTTAVGYRFTCHKQLYEVKNI